MITCIIALPLAALKHVMYVMDENPFRRLAS